MIRIYSIDQALALRGKVPDLALVRSVQFQGTGYVPQIHGSIIVVQFDDDISGIREIGPKGLVLFDEDGLPTFEYAEAFLEDQNISYEVVFQIDDSRTVAVIIADGPLLDAQLRSDLQLATGHAEPTPLPPMGEKRQP